MFKELCQCNEQAWRILKVYPTSPLWRAKFALVSPFFGWVFWWNCHILPISQQLRWLKCENPWNYQQVVEKRNQIYINYIKYINECHNSYITSVENQEITVKPVNPHSWLSRWTTPLPSAATAPPGRGSRRGLRRASGNRGKRRGRRLGRCWRPRKRIDSSRAPLLKPCWTWGKRPWHQRRHCWSWRYLLDQ